MGLKGKDERNIRIRLLGREDLQRIDEIEKASFPSPWSKDALRVQISSPISLNLGIEVNGILVGYFMSYLASDESHILNFAIDPNFRRRGFGSKLLMAALSVLKKRGVRRVFLEVREGNLPAINLYSKLGFSVCGKRKGYYSDTGEDALVMLCFLRDKK